MRDAADADALNCSLTNPCWQDNLHQAIKSEHTENSYFGTTTDRGDIGELCGYSYPRFISSVGPRGPS
jgi:hypothetical protein